MAQLAVTIKQKSDTNETGATNTEIHRKTTTVDDPSFKSLPKFITPSQKQHNVNF